MRWDLLDKYEVIRKGEFSRAHKRFKGTEDFFKENFPGCPVIPEALFLEMIAQAGGVLYGLNDDFKSDVILAKISDAKFGEPVAATSDLVVESRIEEQREEGAWISGTVQKSGETVARAKILLITMPFESGKNEGIVFSNEFLKTYDIRNIARQSELS